MIVQPARHEFPVVRHVMFSAFVNEHGRAVNAVFNNVKCHASLDEEIRLTLRKLNFAARPQGENGQKNLVQNGFEPTAFHRIA